MNYTVYAKKPGDKAQVYQVTDVESHVEAIAMVKKEHPDKTVLAYLSEVKAEPVAEPV